MTINPPSNVVADEKALLRSLLASSGDCIKILDLDGNLLFMTEGGQRVMEVTDFGTIKGCPWPDFWHGQGNIDAKAALASARAGNPGRFRGFATTMAGTPKCDPVALNGAIRKKWLLRRMRMLELDR